MLGIREFNQEELDRIFGKPEYEIVPNSSSIKITNNWERDNFVIAIIPQLVGIPAYHGQMENRLYCHRKMVPIYKSLFKDFEKEGVMEDIIFYGGCFERRLITGSNSKPSSHLYSLSLDINPQWNKWDKPSAGPGEKGSLHRLAPIFAKHGFMWGKDFPTEDGMHLQYGFVIEETIKPLTNTQRAVKVIKEQLAIIEKEGSDN